MKFIKFILFLSIITLIIFTLLAVNFINDPSFILKKLDLDNKKNIEKLVFRIKYVNFIPLGEVIMENKGVKKMNGREAYHLKAYAKPNKFFNFFRKVQIEIDSFIDKDTLLPVKFTQNLWVQGKPPEKKEVIYYQSKQFMEIEGEKRIIYPHTYDPLSLFFSFLNRKDLIERGVIDLNINTNQKNYRFIAKVEKSKKIYKRKVFWIKGEVRRRDGSPRHSSTFRMLVLDSPQLPICIKVFSGLGFISVYLVSVN